MYKNTSRFLSFSIIFLILIFLVRDIGSVKINPYLITVLLSAIACVLTYKDLIAYSCFMLPLSCGVQSFVWIVIIMCLLVKKPKVPPLTIALFLLFFLLEIVDQMFTVIMEPEIKNTIFYFASLFVTFYLINDVSKSSDYSKNIRWFIFGSSFLLAVIFTRVILQYGWDELLTGTVRYKMDDTTISGEYVFYTNANNLGLYSAVCFSILLFIGKEKLRLNNLIYILIFVIVLLGGMLTFSRTWLILVIACLLTYFLLSKKNMSFFFVLFILISLAALVLSSDYYMSIYEIFDARLNADDIKDGAGRTDLFVSYNQFFMNNERYWLTGTGSVYYMDICQQQNSIHNMLQQTYVCYGLGGVIGIFALFFGIIKTGIKHLANKNQYVPLICYLIFVQTVQFFNPIFCMYPLVICSYCLKLNDDINKLNE